MNSQHIRSRSFWFAQKSVNGYIKNHKVKQSRQNGLASMSIFILNTFSQSTKFSAFSFHDVEYVNLKIMLKWLQRKLSPSSFVLEKCWIKKKHRYKCNFLEYETISYNIALTFQHGNSKDFHYSLNEATLKVSFFFQNRTASIRLFL